MRPGISCSASAISLRPKSAWERSATLKSGRSVGVLLGAVVVMRLLRDGPRAATRRGSGSRPGSPDDSSWEPDCAALYLLGAGERRLQLGDGVDGPRVDVVVEGQVARHPVAE